MDASPQVRVTLSDDLVNHLRKMAQSKHVPLLWLVVGLVCDTFESGLERSVDRIFALTGYCSRNPLCVAYSSATRLPTIVQVSGSISAPQNRFP